MSRSYEDLKAEVKRLQSEGKADIRLTAEERADWAWGNTKIENSRVTRKLALAAVRAKS